MTKLRLYLQVKEINKRFDCLEMELRDLLQNTPTSSEMTINTLKTTLASYGDKSYTQMRNLVSYKGHLENLTA